MGKNKIEKTTIVKERHWGPDDDYLVVEVQVDELDVKKGEKVTVTVEKDRC